ncbi:hypothetical protein SAMN05661096_00871 [Marivirga sericea]|uniref:AAA domain-containing protein n=1 Tax=Marivirga sericea TaxID=1028 RepID=A0A1X7ING1_9BACT|nr:hypothetical protein [Marivirga sericea]SMG16573.1 hypothetical protein SAMN05661096_00871 [Marivirga sericea]
MIRHPKKEIYLTTGLALTGKSTYIEEKLNNKNYFIIDYAENFLNLFQSYDGINSNDKSETVYDEILKKAKHSFEDTNSTLVVEYCTGFHSSTLKLERLIDLLEVNNWKVYVKQMQIGLNAHRLQKAAENDPSYCPSMLLNEHHYNIITRLLKRIG